MGAAFTFHGFRYAEVDGWPGELDPAAFTAVVVHTDLERTGWFTCSDPLLNRLHENVVWGMRGNFVDVPTDCPQRDERLGWTGDIQVFAPTATLPLRRAPASSTTGSPTSAPSSTRTAPCPLVVPVGPLDYGGLFAAAAWGDAATIVPWTAVRALRRPRRAGPPVRQHARPGSTACTTPRRRRAPVARGVPARRLARSRRPARRPRDRRRPTECWSPPPTSPAPPRSSVTPRGLLGETVEAGEYRALAAAVRRAFRARVRDAERTGELGRATAYALALEFDLSTSPSSGSRAGARLAAAGRRRAGTASPPASSAHPSCSRRSTAVGDTDDRLSAAHRDRVPVVALPGDHGRDDDLGALGQHAARRLDQPGRDDLVQPLRARRGRRLAAPRRSAASPRPSPATGGCGSRRCPAAGSPRRAARCARRTGPASCEWRLDGSDMTVEVTLPPNTSGLVMLPGGDESHEVGSGEHRWAYQVPDEVVAVWADTPVD